MGLGVQVQGESDRDIRGWRLENFVPKFFCPGGEGPTGDSKLTSDTQTGRGKRFAPR